MPSTFESRRRIGITHYLFCQSEINKIGLRWGIAPLKPLSFATKIIAVAKLIIQLIGQNALFGFPVKSAV